MVLMRKVDEHKQVLPLSLEASIEVTKCCLGSGHPSPNVKKPSATSSPNLAINYHIT